MAREIEKQEVTGKEERNQQFSLGYQKYCFLLWNIEIDNNFLYSERK